MVLGNQKSGTTAISVLLAQSARLTSTIDTSLLWEPNLSKVLKSEITLREIFKRHPAVFQKELVKEPNLTFMFPQVMEVYNDSNFLFISRNPLDNIRSLLNRLQLSGSYLKLDRIHISHFGPHESLLFNRQLFHIDKIHYIDILAERWNIAADVYLNNQDKVRLIRYEDFKMDKKAYIETLAKDLGLQVKNDISGLVNKQYQPAGNSSVTYLDFFGEENLNRINTICGSRMKQLGY